MKTEVPFEWIRDGVLPTAPAPDREPRKKAAFKAPAKKAPAKKVVKAARR